jgi:hypothetical protein
MSEEAKHKLHQAMLRGADDDILALRPLLGALDDKQKSFLMRCAISLDKPVALRVFLEGHKALLNEEMIEQGLGMALKVKRTPGPRLTVLAVLEEYVEDKEWLYYEALSNAIKHDGKEAFRYIVEERGYQKALTSPLVMALLCQKTHQDMALFVLEEFTLLEEQRRKLALEAMQRGKVLVLHKLAETMDDFTWLNALEGRERVIFEHNLTDSFSLRNGDCPGLYNFMYDHNIRPDMRQFLFYKSFELGNTGAIKEFLERPLPVPLVEALAAHKNISYFTLHVIAKINDEMRDEVLRLAVKERKLELFTELFIDEMRELATIDRMEIDFQLMKAHCAFVLDIVTGEAGAVEDYRQLGAKRKYIHQAEIVMAERLGHEVLYREAVKSFENYDDKSWDETLARFMKQDKYRLLGYFEKNQRGFFLMHHLAKSRHIKAVLQQMIEEGQCDLLSLENLCHEGRGHHSILRQMRDHGYLDELKNPLLWRGREAELRRVSAYIAEKGLSKRWDEGAILSKLVQMNMREKALPGFRLKKKAP